MTHSVALSPEAKADILRLVVFLHQKSPAAAMRAEQTIRKALSTLSDSPARGRPTSDPDVRELVIPFNRRAYVARFLIEPGAVTVLGLRHSHEDPAG